MNKEYDRKQFIKTAALANAAFYTRPLKKALDLYSKFAPDANVTYYQKGDALYDQLRQGFNKRIDKHPKIIALCQNTDGVAAAIKYAIANKLPVAIKSGGHCMEGFSCNDDGMVINLSLLNSVEWAGKDSI